MKKRTKLNIAGIVLLLILFSCARQTPPARFTAIIAISENDSTVLEGVIFVDGWRYRMNLTLEGEAIGIIVDNKSDWTRLLMANNKTCSYIHKDDPENIASDPFLGLEFLKAKYGGRRIGNATIGGYDCIEYEIKDDGRKLMAYWEAAALRFPLRIIEHGSTDIVTELSDIIVGNIDDSIFGVPGNYTILARRWTAGR